MRKIIHFQQIGISSHFAQQQQYIHEISLQGIF